MAGLGVLNYLIAIGVSILLDDAGHGGWSNAIQIVVVVMLVLESVGLLMALAARR